MKNSKIVWIFMLIRNIYYVCTDIKHLLLMPLSTCGYTFSPIEGGLNKEITTNNINFQTATSIIAHTKKQVGFGPIITMQQWRQHQLKFRSAEQNQGMSFIEITTEGLKAFVSTMWVNNRWVQWDLGVVENKLINK